MRPLALTLRTAACAAAVVLAAAGPAGADQEDAAPARHAPAHAHHAPVHRAHSGTAPADAATRDDFGGAEAYGLALSGGTAMAVAGLAVRRRRRPAGPAAG
ncbi:hypothetical protein [Streptomyces sparsogenes]|uniref:Uncharacterized protein n=1 Tax=Streptomyces sparsogenes DSM 40356 TaxID=1331668 RepID=A0A1R1S6H4_9ACTN|nr:hypothetical protein [Streptomyces sparsogenes]OMI33843.1 hypothetical protein SPAR_39393 [Streptomyces sparsogenes DSM 40356]